MSRLGNPLVNEVVVPTGVKDQWNRSQPVNDKQYAGPVVTPILAKLMNDLYKVNAPTTNRDDLIAVFGTGVKGLNFTGDTVADMLRLNYFGIGSDAPKANRSGYRLDQTDILGYATVRQNGWLSVNGRFGWIHEAELSTMTGWSVTYPNTLDVFTDATTPGLTEKPDFLHSDVSISADTRREMASVFPAPAHATTCKWPPRWSITCCCSGDGTKLAVPVYMLQAQRPTC